MRLNDLLFIVRPRYNRLHLNSTERIIFPPLFLIGSNVQWLMLLNCVVYKGKLKISVWLGEFDKYSHTCLMYQL